MPDPLHGPKAHTFASACPLGHPSNGFSQLHTLPDQCRDLGAGLRLFRRRRQFGLGASTTPARELLGGLFHQRQCPGPQLVDERRDLREDRLQLGLVRLRRLPEKSRIAAAITLASI